MSINVLEKLKLKRYQINKLIENYQGIQVSHADMRLRENIVRSENFRNLGCPLEYEGNSFVANFMITGLQKHIYAYRTTRNKYEKILISGIKKNRVSARRHRNRNQLVPTDEEDAKVHDAIADYFMGQLRESYMTDYTNRASSEIPGDVRRTLR